MPGAYLPAMKYSALHNNPLLRRGRPLPTPLPCREQIVTVMERLCGIGVKRNRRTDHQSCDRKSGTNVMWLNVIKAQRIQQWDVGGPRGKGLGVTGALPYLIARFVLLCVSFPSLPPLFFGKKSFHTSIVSVILKGFWRKERAKHGPRLRASLLNPLHPNISMNILHTVLCTFPKVLTRRICLPIKRFFPWWSFSLFSWP